MSICWCPARIWWAAFVTDACEARSSSTSSSFGSAVDDRICSTASAALAWLRTAMTTWAPLPASTFAVCRPRPPFAPVTTAVRPVRSGTESLVYDICVSLPIDLDSVLNPSPAGQQCETPVAHTGGNEERGGEAVTEQPNDLVVESMDEAPAVAQPIHHEHVRTEGETSVDDALGTTDDPADS